MAIVSLLWMDTATRDALLLLNDSQSDFNMDPRVIDNPLANQLGEGEIVGDWVASANVLNDPGYSRFNDICSQLPIKIWDSEILFLPVEV